MNFRLNLAQFYINFSRQEHQIDVLYVSLNAWDSQVSLYPLSFFLYSPFKEGGGVVTFSLICLELFVNNEQTNFTKIKFKTRQMKMFWKTKTFWIEKKMLLISFRSLTITKRVFFEQKNHKLKRSFFLKKVERGIDPESVYLQPFQFSQTLPFYPQCPSLSKMCFIDVVLQTACKM